MDKFAWMGTFSGFFSRPIQDVTEYSMDVFKDPAAFDKQMNPLFISTGTEEKAHAEGGAWRLSKPMVSKISFIANRVLAQHTNG